MTQTMTEALTTYRAQRADHRRLASRVRLMWLAFAALAALASAVCSWLV